MRMNIKKKQNNKIIKEKTPEEIKHLFESFSTGYDSTYVLKKANKELAIKHTENNHVEPDSFYYKVLTMLEFDKGILLMSSVPEISHVFALEFSKNLQTEYNCKSPSEKSLAEVVALNFVRTLSIQAKINSYLSLKTIDDLGIKYLDLLSKELDRAQRHYLISLQTLRMLKMPQLEVNIKTQNAFVGNNQVLQKNEIN